MKQPHQRFLLCCLLAVFLCLLVVTVQSSSSLHTSWSENDSSSSNTNMYSSSDVNELLKEKQEQLQQVSNSLKETSILLDAFIARNQVDHPSFKSYETDKLTTRKELNELKLLLEFEISNIQFLLLNNSSQQKQEQQQSESKQQHLKEELEMKLKVELEHLKLGDLKQTTLLNSKQLIRFNNETMKGIPLASSSNGIKLLYKASKEGFSARKFHDNCDYKGPTIVIVKSSSGAVFGGYSSISWTSANIYFTDKSAFLFSLISGKNEERFTKLTQERSDSYKKGTRYGYSIHHQTSNGPTFGGGYDLHIYDKCNSNTSSYSMLCHTYCDDTLEYGSDPSKQYLSGSPYFQVEDYEVYTW